MSIIFENVPKNSKHFDLNWADKNKYKNTHYNSDDIGIDILDEIEPLIHFVVLPSGTHIPHALKL